MNQRLRSFLVLGLVILLALTLAGCNRERPAVTNDKGTPAPGRGTVAAPEGSPSGAASATTLATTPTAPSPQVQSTAAGPQAGGGATAVQTTDYTVKAGDNLAAIAARFGTTVDAIARLNGISDPNALSLGQVLKIPGTGAVSGASAPVPTAAGAPAASAAPGSYTVQAGDTLGKIAQRFGTTSAELARLNNLTNPDQIKVGQKLQVPGAGGAGAGTTTSAPTTTTGQGRTHTVARGETLGTIAKRYGVTVKQIQAANNISNPDRIYVGQKLLIP